MSAPATQPRRSARLAAKADAEAAAKAAADDAVVAAMYAAAEAADAAEAVAPVLAAPIRKAAAKAAAKAKARSMTREEHYEHLVATDPKWAAIDAKRKAGKALRDAYQAGAWATAPTPQLLAMHEVVQGVAALKARLEAATTVEEFQACAALADRELYNKASVFEWADPMGMMFLTDTRRYSSEALIWLTWDKECPAKAAAYAYALAHEDDEDYTGVPAYKLNPQYTYNLCSESIKDAREWAVKCVGHFARSMF